MKQPHLVQPIKKKDIQTENLSVSTADQEEGKK